MNKRQKLVQQRYLNNEEAVITALKSTYGQALDDVNARIKILDLDIDSTKTAIDMWEDYGGGDDEKAQLQSMMRSKIYQKRYQEAIQGQLEDVMEKLQNNAYTTVASYLKDCYDDGFIGTLYDLQGQGVPLIMPMDQESIVRAVQLDSKISGGLYSRMGEDVAKLKKAIAAEVTRGIATGMTYDQVAKQITYKMTSTKYRDGGALARAKTIARTEGHRIQCQAGMDACYRARDVGAEVVKQWDATLDAKTRESHQQVDGQVRELDEKFSNGLMFPGDPSGGAAEVVNCRCSLLQRARFEIGKPFTKMNNFTKEIETFNTPEEYDEFKKAFWSKENKDFMKYHTTLEDRYETKDFKKLLGSMDDKEYKHWQKLYNNSPMYNTAAKGLTNTSKSDRIKLPDTPIYKGVGARAKNYDVFDPETGEYFRFVEDTKIQNSEVFAGNGVKKPLRPEVAEGLTEEFGGSPEKWQHAKGFGTIDYYGEELDAEVHWFQEESVGKVKFKVKKWLG